MGRLGLLTQGEFPLENGTDELISCLSRWKVGGILITDWFTSWTAWRINRINNIICEEIRVCNISNHVWNYSVLPEDLQSCKWWPILNPETYLLLTSSRAIWSHLNRNISFILSISLPPFQLRKNKVFSLPSSDKTLTGSLFTDAAQRAEHFPFVK